MLLRGLRSKTSTCALIQSAKWCQPKPYFFRNLMASAHALSPSPRGNGASDIPSTVEETSVEEYPTGNNTTSAMPTPSPSSFLERLSDDAVDASETNWAKSYHGLSSEPFGENIADILQAPLDPDDIEMKPGILSHHSNAKDAINNRSQFKRRAPVPSRD